jgi:putative transposase
VWARLPILRDMRVARARVLRLMREHGLLSPHRRPLGNPMLHDGSLQTNHPNAMWGTDGIRIETVDEGWVWVFAAVDHFDACCVGIQYTADDFLNQVRFWGIAPSFAFVAEPQTNGVAERFNRTLKEQAIHGRVFRNVEEVRSAVTAFKDRYNRYWRLEKLGFRTPDEARQAYAMQKAA